MVMNEGNDIRSVLATMDPNLEERFTSPQKVTTCSCDVPREPSPERPSQLGATSLLRSHFGKVSNLDHQLSTP